MTEQQQAIAKAIKSLIVWERIWMTDLIHIQDTKTSREAKEHYRKELKELGIDLDSV